MNKTNLPKTTAVVMAIGLVFTLAGAGCSRTPTSSEMDFTYRAKSDAEITEFWKNDVPYVVVQMTDDNQFSPKEIKVSAGRSIMWQNSGSDKHTVTPDDPKWARNSVGINSSGDGGMGSGSIRPKSAWRWQIPEDAKVGTKIYYHCGFHGQTGDGKNFGTGMVGVIAVK